MCDVFTHVTSRYAVTHPSPCHQGNFLKLYLTKISNIHTTKKMFYSSYLIQTVLHRRKKDERDILNKWEMFMEVRRAGRFGISEVLSSGWAPNLPQLLLALPLPCPTTQGPFRLFLPVLGSGPSDSLCCRTGHSPPLSPRCAQEGSDTLGQSASPPGADAASTPCNGC